jgi:hypothetical protein
MRRIGRGSLVLRAGSVVLLAAGLVGCDAGGTDSTPESATIWDTDVVRRKYYFVEHPESLVVAPRDSLGNIYAELELFLDDRDKRTDAAEGAVPGIAFMFADSTSGDPWSPAGGHLPGRFHRLRINEDYSFDSRTGALTLERTLPTNQILALTAVRITGDSLGSAGANMDTLRLQILAPPERDLYEDARGFAPARDLELKNIYSLGARNIEPDTFELVIWRLASSASGEEEEGQLDKEGKLIPFVQIMALDHRGRAGPDPDHFVEPEFIDYEEGTITFPNITPFSPDSSRVNVIASPESVATGREDLLQVAGARDPRPQVPDRGQVHDTVVSTGSWRAHGPPSLR